jgi:hypothetical protein
MIPEGWLQNCVETALWASIGCGQFAKPSDPDWAVALIRTQPAYHTTRPGRPSATKAANLTSDNKMTRKPNFALNAEMKAVAERLTLPAVLVHFFRFAPTAIE